MLRILRKTSKSMKTYKLSKFTRGWFIGDFPSLIRTKKFEVALKEYKKGDKEEAHYHKVADEITVVAYGKCRLNNKIFKKGDIIWLEPGEIAKFEALEDTANVIVKIPSVKGDKYEIV